MKKTKAPKQEIEEIVEGEVEEEIVISNHKEHHWSDDGPRYNVFRELSDSVPGTLHYGSFFETNKLDLAKEQCLAEFEKHNVTTFILDRAERMEKIVVHEAVKKEMNDEQLRNNASIEAQVSETEIKPRKSKIKRKQF